MSGFLIVSAPSRRVAQLSFAGAKPQPERAAERRSFARPPQGRKGGRPARRQSARRASSSFRQAASSFVKRRQALSRIPLAVSCDFKGLAGKI